MAFTNEQIERYSRHIILKEVGAKGQKKLLNAKVLVIGAGGRPFQPPETDNPPDNGRRQAEGTVRKGDYGGYEP